MCLRLSAEKHIPLIPLCNSIHSFKDSLQVFGFGEADPVAEGDTHIAGRLFPVALVVLLQREDIGIAGAEKHFLQGADFVDDFVESAFARHTCLTLDDEQFVGLDEADVEFVVVADASVGDMYPHRDIIGMHHFLDERIDVFFKPASGKVFYFIALKSTLLFGDEADIVQKLAQIRNGSDRPDIENYESASKTCSNKEWESCQVGWVSPLD